MLYLLRYYMVHVFINNYIYEHVLHEKNLQRSKGVRRLVNSQCFCSQTPASGGFYKHPACLRVRLDQDLILKGRNPQKHRQLPGKFDPPSISVCEHSVGKTAANNKTRPESAPRELPGKIDLNRGKIYIYIYIYI